MASGKGLALSLLMLAHASAFTTVGLAPARFSARRPLLGGGAVCVGALGKGGGPGGGGSAAALRGSRGTRAWRSVSRGACALRASFDEPLFEKDVVEFSLSEETGELVAQATALPGCGGATSMLGAIVEPDVPTVQPLCVREKGSKELYADSRLEPFEISFSEVVRFVDTFPGQRPVPSLGGGEGYGAEGIDCWELQEEVEESCLIPLEDTGMGFHQKGW